MKTVKASDQRTSLNWLYRQTWLYERDRPSMRADRRRWVFGALSLASRVYSLKYKAVPFSAPRPTRLQLGSGRTRMSGWVNADINPIARPDLWVDLRHRWPLGDGSISVVYARHCLEHFLEREVRDILAECARVLEPGGVLRIGVPSLERAIKDYLDAQGSFPAWVASYESRGRQLWQYITDHGNHPIAFDFGYLQELMHEAGFTGIAVSRGGSSGLIAQALLPPEDSTRDETTLYVECVKP